MLSPTSLPAGRMETSGQGRGKEAHKSAVAARQEVTKVLEAPGCLQWLCGGALPRRPTDRGKGPNASATCGSAAPAMGKPTVSFKPQCGHEENPYAALNGAFFFFPCPGSHPARGLSPHGCAAWGRRCPAGTGTRQGQEELRGAARALCPEIALLSAGQGVMKS